MNWGSTAQQQRGRLEAKTQIRLTSYYVFYRTLVGNCTPSAMAAGSATPNEASHQPLGMSHVQVATTALAADDAAGLSWFAAWRCGRLPVFAHRRNLAMSAAVILRRLRPRLIGGPRPKSTPSVEASTAAPTRQSNQWLSRLGLAFH